MPSEKLERQLREVKEDAKMIAELFMRKASED